MVVGTGAHRPSPVGPAGVAAPAVAPITEVDA